jgi:hypothetical protein
MVRQDGVCRSFPSGEVMKSLWRIPLKRHDAKTRDPRSIIARLGKGWFLFASQARLLAHRRLCLCRLPRRDVLVQCQFANGSKIVMTENECYAGTDQERSQSAPSDLREGRGHLAVRKRTKATCPTIPAMRCESSSHRG